MRFLLAVIVLTAFATFSVQAQVKVREQPSIEIGIRNWISSGKINFKTTLDSRRANGSLIYGNPTSTLDWEKITASGGEVFIRANHLPYLPTRIYVKGGAGISIIMGGHMVDEDFKCDQSEFSSTTCRQQKFSSTTSVVSGKTIYSGLIDIGINIYQSKSGDSRVGVIAGYHFLREKIVAYGVFNNPGMSSHQTSVDTPVVIYEPTWNAFRVGMDGKFTLTRHWSLAFEGVMVPFLKFRNEDSHLLRTSLNDLGPAPNLIYGLNHGKGFESEIFSNWELAPTVEVSVGYRYWGLSTRQQYRPRFSFNFEEQRFGLLLEIKKKM